MATDLRTLIRSRGIIKGQCTRIRTFLTETENPSVSDLLARRKRLEELRKEFEAVQFEIEDIDETADHENERDQFETLHLECLSLICKVLEPFHPSVERQGTASSPSCASTCNVRSQSIAPRVRIKEFDGNFADWNSFYDTFKSVVREDENTPAVQKFELLKSHLKGEAFAVISVLNASEENYNVAWESLKETYNMPRKIIEAHIRALFELKEASKNSPNSMRALVVKAQLHVKALKSQGEPVEWHEMLIYILTSKLDKETRNLWEQSLVRGQRPTTEELFAFFKKYSSDSEPVQLVTHNTEYPSRETQFSKLRPPDKPKRFTQGYVTTSQDPQCGICKGAHYITRCEEFNRLEGNERYEAARKANLCINCLRAGHWTKQCRSSSCQKCQGRHHTLLHKNSPVNGPNKQFRNESIPPTSKACPVALTAQVSKEILLSTAKITILGKDKKEYDCRVLLDSGSQSNFIAEGLARKLELPTTRVDIPAAGLGQKATTISRKITTTIKDRHSKFMQETEFLILPKITSLLPSQFVDRDSLKIPDCIELADPDFHKPNEIDALLGEQLFYKLLCDGQLQLGNKTAILQKTKVGWIVSGSVKPIEASPLERKCYFTQIPLKHQLENLGRIEECQPRMYLSQAEDLKACSDSDNATNFTGSKNELVELQARLNSLEHNERVMDNLACNNVIWHFSPPRAPNFGGLWESALKSFKHHMVRTIGDTLFTYEQLNNYVTEVEAILNSRLLIPLSADPNDLNALTLSHFLIGESMTGLPEHDYSDVPTNRLPLWQHIQRVKQHFWARWHKEYFNEISLRTKWRTGSTKQLKMGELVLLKEDNVPPMRWMLGRIIDTQSGEDNIFKVATVKTTSGAFKRSIQKLCPLPLSNDPANNKLLLNKVVQGGRDVPSRSNGF